MATKAERGFIAGALDKVIGSGSVKTLTSKDGTEYLVLLSAYQDGFGVLWYKKRFLCAQCHRKRPARSRPNRQKGIGVGRRSRGGE
ncbi:MAG: hypothetical protein LBG75_03170 [Candidatus Nomurabacteria bacterium]|jgi:hypothetical protein|nr:hypothetical protein [Candidatus Nomurabacteria bacterium]